MHFKFKAWVNNNFDNAYYCHNFFNEVMESPEVVDGGYTKNQILGVVQDQITKAQRVLDTGQSITVTANTGQSETISPANADAYLVEAYQYWYGYCIEGLLTEDRSINLPDFIIEMEDAILEAYEDGLNNQTIIDDLIKQKKQKETDLRHSFEEFDWRSFHNE